MNKIKALRELKGLTQQNLADHLGLGRSTVAMYESGKSEPDFASLIKMSSLFGVTVDEIVCNTSRRTGGSGANQSDDADVYSKARFVNDFTNKAKIIAALKEIIILPKSKENLILQILEADEKASGCKYEFIAEFDELDLRQQYDVLAYMRKLASGESRARSSATFKNPKSQTVVAERGVISVYQNKGTPDKE